MSCRRNPVSARPGCFSSREHLRYAVSMSSPRAIGATCQRGERPHQAGAATIDESAMIFRVAKDDTTPTLRIAHTHSSALGACRGVLVGGDCIFGLAPRRCGGLVLCGRVRCSRCFLVRWGFRGRTTFLAAALDNRSHLLLYRADALASGNRPCGESQCLSPLRGCCPRDRCCRRSTRRILLDSAARARDRHRALPNMPVRPDGKRQRHLPGVRYADRVNRSGCVQFRLRIHPTG